MHTILGILGPGIVLYTDEWSDAKSPTAETSCQKISCKHEFTDWQTNGQKYISRNPAIQIRLVKLKSQ